MRKQIVNLLAFKIISSCVFSQAVYSSISSPAIGAYSLNHADVFSFHSNQAALAKTKNLSVGVSGERRFMLKELSFYNLSIALPAHSGNFALDAKYFGFIDYTETQLGLAYARSLGEKIDLGVQFNYYSQRIPAYGNVSLINFEVGAIMQLSEKLRTGFHVANPAGGKFGKDNEEKIPSFFSCGFGYDASEIFFISTEIEKEEDQPINVLAGFRYKFLQQLLAGCGVSTTTSSFYFEVGFLWKSMWLQVTTFLHQQLGLSPGLKLIFTSDKKKN